jgi:predicted anti-sigma-YlaC factor YlaD
MNSERVRKLVLRCVCWTLAVLAIAQFYMVRELVVVWIGFSLLFCMLGISLVVFELFYEVGWRGLDWIIAHASSAIARVHFHGV